MVTRDKVVPISSPKTENPPREMKGGISRKRPMRWSKVTLLPRPPRPLDCSFYRLRSRTVLLRQNTPDLFGNPYRVSFPPFGNTAATTMNSKQGTVVTVNQLISSNSDETVDPVAYTDPIAMQENNATHHVLGEFLGSDD